MLMKKLVLMICFALIGWACAAPGQIATNTPQQQQDGYPPFVEDTPERSQFAQEAWKKFLAEWRLPELKPDLTAVLNAPRALPAELVGRININTKSDSTSESGSFGEMEAKEAISRFIGRSGSVLSGDSISLSELSLVTFANEGNFYRAVFWQANYPFQIAEGYGELSFVVGKKGELLQLSSSLLPAAKLPTRAEIKNQAIYDKLIGRQFSYSTIAGQPQSYKVTKREEVKIGELMVYPKLEGKRLEIHLAFPVTVGNGTNWTVYIDAINGDELGVKQNFAS